MLKKQKNSLVTLMALSVVSAIYIMIHCPIKYLTGISCPGCGMIRAYLCLLKLDFMKSFYYHPLWPIPAIYLFIYCFYKNKNGRIYNSFVLFAIILFATVYCYRLFNNDDIVNIRVKTGLLYKLFYSIFNG